MKNCIYILSLCVGVSLLNACSSDETTADDVQQLTAIRLTTDIVPMNGDNQTRVNDEGTSFLPGDLIRLKMITPYVNMGETGSHTWSATQDNFYLLKWNSATADWDNKISDKGFDVDGNGSFGDNGPSLTYLPQQTPYVFTANTWSECVNYKIQSDVSRVEYKNVFYADQSTQAHYRSSDLLWAQTIMQTGTDNVRLSFSHVMSCLQVTIDNQSGTSLTDPVVTLEGVPDIDLGEVVVGNYYSQYDVNLAVKYGSGAVSKITDKTENGKALGIASISSDGTAMNLVRFTTDATTEGKVSNTGTYIGYKYAENIYRFIVPPFTGSDVTIWLRDGARRYESSLGANFTFSPSQCYKYTFTIPAP